MRYIKLFEAFESKALSNLLNFLKNKFNDTDKFLNEFKKILTFFNIPMDKISDSNVKYLNTSKAIKIRNEEEIKLELKEKDIVLPEKWFVLYRNADEFKIIDDYYKKSWNYYDPRDGKFGYFNSSDDRNNWVNNDVEFFLERGYKEIPFDVFFSYVNKNKTEVHCIKFWFSLDKGYLGRTGVGNKTSNGLGSFNEEEIAYIKNKKINKGIIKPIINYLDLKTGDMIIGYLESPDRKENIIISTIFKDLNGIYAIQDYKSGSQPYDTEYNGVRWKKFGKYSYSIYTFRDNNWIRQTDNFKLHKYIPGKDPLTIEGLSNYYNFNLPLNKYLQLEDWNDNNKHNIDIIKNSEFCIVLYINDILKTEYNPLNKTIAQRIESKKGALKLMSDEDIKKANIKRYLDKIIINMGIHIETTAVNNLQKIIILLTCDEYSLISLFRNDPNFDNLYIFMDDLYFLLTTKEKKDKEYYINNLNKSYFSLKDRNKLVKDLYSKSYDEIMKSNNKELIEIIKIITNTGEKIKKYLLSQNIQSIEDLSIITHKLKSIRDIMSNKYISLHYNIRDVFYSFGNSDDVIYYCNSIKVKNIEDEIKKAKLLDKYVDSIL